MVVDLTAEAAEVASFEREAALRAVRIDTVTGR